LSVLTAIDQVRVAGHSLSTHFPDRTIYVTADHDIEVAVYTLFTDNDSENEYSDSEDHCSQSFAITSLPHESFDGLWELLIYEEPVGEFTLRALVRAIKEGRLAPRSRTTRCNNTVLFHGPPGSGKTMLAQALAQRLSIRLSNIYAHTKFLEIDSHALLSKFFGESSKQVGMLFESILDIAKDGSELVVVLFDEVETIASSREKALQAAEVADAIRVSILIQGD
jgi:SpoVK/Ycf46/Vps4 family AAA+-type ATPase